MARRPLRTLRETLALVTQTDPNTYGTAYGLTSLIPIMPGHEDELEAHLASLDPLDSPLARLQQLHFSRLHVIRDLVYQGPPQAPESLESSYLIFTTSHDGELEPFLRELAEKLGPSEVDAIWGHCLGYPGTADPGAFAEWVTTHRKDNGYLLTPWPFKTVQDVREALRVQTGFGGLVERARDMSDAELQAAFRTLMAGRS
jgi:hypothetical protein